MRVRFVIPPVMCIKLAGACSARSPHGVLQITSSYGRLNFFATPPIAVGSSAQVKLTLLYWGWSTRKFVMWWSIRAYPLFPIHTNGHFLRLKLRHFCILTYI